MQSYLDIPETDSLTASRLKLINNTLTAMSCSSGTVFPTANLQVGMFCLRTDQNKLYQLKDATPTWTLIFDLAKTATDKEYVDAGLATKQPNLTGAATTIASSNLTVSRALASDASGKVAVSATTAAELGYLSGVTSAVQTQLNGKQPLDATLTSLSGAGVSAFAKTLLDDADAATARGTLAAAAETQCGLTLSSGIRVPRSVAANTDFNTLTESGVYNFDATSSLNKPAGVGWPFLEVYRHNNTANLYVVQVCYDMNGLSENTAWSRKYNGGAWTAWTQFAGAELGVGQSWHTVTRSWNTTYYNTRATPMMVSVGITSVAAQNHAYAQLVVGGISLSLVGIGGNFAGTSYGYSQATAIVEPGQGYYVNTVSAGSGLSINKWAEFY